MTYQSIFELIPQDDRCNFTDIMHAIQYHYSPKPISLAVTHMIRGCLIREAYSPFVTFSIRENEGKWSIDGTPVTIIESDYHNVMQITGHGAFATTTYYIPKAVFARLYDTLLEPSIAFDDLKFYEDESETDDE